MRLATKNKTIKRAVVILGSVFMLLFFAFIPTTQAGFEQTDSDSGLEQQVFQETVGTVPFPMPKTEDGEYLFFNNTGGSYCRSEQVQSPYDAASYAAYSKPYNKLNKDQTVDINSRMLNSKPRDPTGLVPCGRSCDDPTTSVNEAADCTFCHFFGLFNNIINWILKFVVTSLAVLLVVIGGFLLATSRGNPSQLQKGKDILIWTFAGLAVIFVGWAVLNSLLSGIGVQRWTGLRAESGEFELYRAYSTGHMLQDNDKTGNKAWKRGELINFNIRFINSAYWPEPETRKITNNTESSIYINEPLFPQDKDEKLEYEIGGGWWQFACELPAPTTPAPTPPSDAAPEIPIFQIVDVDIKDIGKMNVDYEDNPLLAALPIGGVSPSVLVIKDLIINFRWESQNAAECRAGDELEIYSPRGNPTQGTIDIDLGATIFIPERRTADALKNFSITCNDSTGALQTTATISICMQEISLCPAEYHP